ncbi:MAG TPA: magnesium chelatase domain-containing protein, partial [Candidatus Sumerlaeota bacterium]|nr:magnesium chelatase domain-containing protein [Candidatus Sumerlaeota bacterium]
TKDFHGDPSAALLEVLDPEQNKAFNDHFLDVDFDLSSVMFITTANVGEDIHRTLLDRMEIIHLPGYTREEKIEIARQFLIPRQIKEHGLSRRNVRFTNEIIASIINEYTREAGVRNLEREIAKICRKFARELVRKKKTWSESVSIERIRKLLGPPRFKDQEKPQDSEVGVATGLAWTELGGEILPTETTVVKGKGVLTLTGQMGNVMQESAKAALTYIRSRSKKFNLRDNFYNQMDIHVHIPEGAIPKDGPSAGVTMATSMLSAISKRPVRQDVAMTGEITLRGRVLKIGGLKEKILAAHRAHIKTIIIPRENKDDLDELPKEVRKDIHFILVNNLDEVLDSALLAKNLPSKPS